MAQLFCARKLLGNTYSILQDFATSAKLYQLHAAKHSSKGEAREAFLRVLKYSSWAVLEFFLSRHSLQNHVRSAVLSTGELLMESENTKLKGILSRSMLDVLCCQLGRC